ncbi:MAG: ATP synthase F1 subunit gamma [Candidatus Saccharibacteria bacterium]|nr:ATP synthase F1 subunit gamma [Candidatus Saccharibacteria bacterium]
MANTTALKRRITSVKNTKQITKAMELVSASKMRRAQEHAARSRAFRNMAIDLLNRLSELTDVTQHPLYKQRAINTRLHILISSDRGLAGALNSNLFKAFTKELVEDRDLGRKSQVIVIGKQGQRFVAKLDGVEVIAAYDGFPEKPTAADIRPILKELLAAFKEERADAVDVTYTDFKTSLLQEVETLRLLPAVFEPTTKEDQEEKAIFEPSPDKVLDAVTERFIELLLSQAFYEAQASEQSMRRNAMKNATDNANDLVDDLTLEFNTARQAAITQELAEITGGAEAMK